MRREFLIASILLTGGLVGAALWYPWVWWSFVAFGPLLILGFLDFFQTHHTIRRNFPLLGRLRYLLELVRPEINQYFIESNSDGRPFSREQRSVVYQRAKNVLDTLPFGTQKDVYQPGYEWVNHSMAPKHVDGSTLRVTIGNEQCSKPYSASILNISAMSYGALSKNAIMALNGGAKLGNFAHNTGEGGISPYHKRNGGDLIWQIGTGYFGCRDKQGKFDSGLYTENAQNPQVKMVEIKISQGAKPGHGGILPAAKVDEEIASIRHVPLGQDVISPPAHSAFSTPIELLEFVARLRELNGGKPVGFKLCIGKRREFFAVCKAMVETQIYPDFISIDGGEGGTGAAPIEFSNYLGTPSTEGIIFAHNALVGCDVRKHVRLLGSGKVVTAFGMIKKLALGADVVYMARGMMLALGCIQALRCNENVCPAGVATQDKSLTAGLSVVHKTVRVNNFHRETILAVSEMLGAMGLSHTEELNPWHILRRVGQNSTKHYSEIYRYLQPGELLGSDVPKEYVRAYDAAIASSFSHAKDHEYR